MGTAKEKAKKQIDSLPDDATIEDILYHLDFVHMIERRLRQAERGETVSHEEAGRIIRGEQELER